MTKRYKLSRWFDAEVDEDLEPYFRLPPGLVIELEEKDAAAGLAKSMFEEIKEPKEEPEGQEGEDLAYTDGGTFKPCTCGSKRYDVYGKCMGCGTQGQYPEPQQTVEKGPKVEIAMDAVALGLCPKCFEKPCKCQPQEKGESCSRSMDCDCMEGSWVATPVISVEEAGLQELFELKKEEHELRDGDDHCLNPKCTQCFDVEEECKHVVHCRLCADLVQLNPQPKEKPSQIIAQKTLQLFKDTHSSSLRVADHMTSCTVQAIIDLLDDQFAKEHNQ